MKVFTCPTCGKRDAFREEKINWHGMLIQQSILDQLTEDNIQEFIKKQNDKNSGPCQECGDLAKKLRICLDCASDQGIIVPTFKGKFTINYSGVTVLGAFYKAKQFSICANCAADGRHAEHKCGLLANVYDETMVDFDLNFALARILDMKFEREARKHGEGSQGYWLNYYKRLAVRIEKNRMETRGELPEYTFKPMNDRNTRDLEILQRKLDRVMDRDALYQRKLQMMYVERIQMILETSEDKEFDEEMRKVAGKILKEEEKLGGEELEEVNQLVKDRILKHCELENPRETANDDCKEALWKHTEAKEEAFTVVVNRYPQHFVKTPDPRSFFYTVRVKETEEAETVETVYIPVEADEEKHRAYLEHANALIEYHEAYSNELLCSVTHLEMIELLFGRGFQLEHPNRLFLLLLFWLQMQLEPITNDTYIGNFIR